MNEDFSRHVSIINVKNKLELEEISSSGEIIYVKCPFCFSKRRRYETKCIQ